jgi:hypothetical protein
VIYLGVPPEPLTRLAATPTLDATQEYCLTIRRAISSKVSLSSGRVTFAAKARQSFEGPKCYTQTGFP